MLTWSCGFAWAASQFTVTRAAPLIPTALGSPPVRRTAGVFIRLRGLVANLHESNMEGYR